MTGYVIYTSCFAGNNREPPRREISSKFPLTGKRGADIVPPCAARAGATGREPGTLRTGYCDEWKIRDTTLCQRVHLLFNSVDSPIS